MYTDMPVYYWVIETLIDGEWKVDSVRYATEFAARLAAESLNIPLENIRLTKHQFDF
jgi:hypothetical protein